MLVKYLKYSVVLLVLLTGCQEQSFNDPYPDEDPKARVLYASFSERPKHLDPANSYSSNEWVITNQIYEPPLQYHHLKRPYQLEPLVTTALPKITYLGKNGEALKSSEEPIAYTVYEITIKPSIYFQPHPAFVKDENHYSYHNLSDDELDDIDVLEDFSRAETRELVADDFVYQIKRLADPTLQSPIFGLMQTHILGLDEYEQKLSAIYKPLNASPEHPSFVQLHELPLEGAKAIDRYTYQITLIGHYPQFIYWLAMPFFAPVPWEAVKFYSQQGLVDKNITLDWYPVGTGPYMLIENNPNQRMTLAKNPHFHGELYPSEGEEKDYSSGILEAKGKKMPFLDKVVFSLEQESIPYWNKFIQGFYDESGISSDSFDQALQSNSEGGLQLTDSMAEKGIHLETAILPTTFYWGFNMLDPIVGGSSLANKKLRQAISVAMDMEEYIQIFMNGRAIPADSPIPPGIFGYREGDNSFNPVLYEKREGKVQKRSIADAKALLKEAGYPAGINPKTNKPLTLYLDATMGGGPDSQAQYAWIRKQLEKIGIDLVVRATQYNRFQEKIRTGNAQIFSWGWNADYPDPENFFFLLYGPHGKVKHGGENAVNYTNAKFDSLFEQMKSMDNGPERQGVIDEMLKLIQEDAPWVWGFHPMMYALSHSWMAPQKANAMSRNTLKYVDLDANKRAQLRLEWNHPTFWPVGVGFGFLILLCLPAFNHYRKKVKTPPRLLVKEE